MLCVNTEPMPKLEKQEHGNKQRWHGKETLQDLRNIKFFNLFAHYFLMSDLLVEVERLNGDIDKLHAE